MYSLESFSFILINFLGGFQRTCTLIGKANRATSIGLWIFNGGVIIFNSVTIV